MLNDELRDRINESRLICDKHLERLQSAFSKLQDKLPLNHEIYLALNEDELAYIDQLIYRFSKLQDVIGKRIFIEVLELLSEDTTELPFIDILNKLEKLNIIEDAKTWLRLRQTRNSVTHEYPTLIQDQLEGLNELFKEVDVLRKIWERLRNYLEERLSMETE